MQPKIRIKMCGMTSEQDIAHAVALGVDAIGLIFYSQSPRSVSLERAKKLLQQSLVFTDVVAVLVNPEALFVEAILNELPIQWLQFHGDEPPDFCNQFKKPYIKAVKADCAENIEKLSAYYQQASAILLDTPSEQYGGTGKPFDWKTIPKRLSQPLILAGGLNASNVSQAIAISSPYAVDVCSGIEASPGVKDHGKMSQFVQALWSKQ